jgi:hypothetical protein
LAACAIRLRTGSGAIFIASPSITRNYRKGFAQFRQRGKAAAIHFDRGHARAGTQKRAGKPAGSWAHFQNVRSGKLAWNCGNAVEQLFVEQEILSQRLLRGQAVARDDVAQGRERGGVIPPQQRPGVPRIVRPCGWPQRLRLNVPRRSRQCRRRCRGPATRTIGKPSVTFTPSSKSST